MKDYVCAILLLIGLAHSAPQLREQAETDWSPITTPDDWIRIQSPTTEKFPQSQESTAEPLTESTIQSLTSDKPITESTIIHDTTKRPTMIDLLSTIATVKINTELPVPTETLNMSDYKQVYARSRKAIGGRGKRGRSRKAIEGREKRGRSRKAIGGKGKRGQRLCPHPRIIGGNLSSGKWPRQEGNYEWASGKYQVIVGKQENVVIRQGHTITGNNIGMKL